MSKDDLVCLLTKAGRKLTRDMPLESVLSDIHGDPEGISLGIIMLGRQGKSPDLALAAAIFALRLAHVEELRLLEDEIVRLRAEAGPVDLGGS